MPTHLIVLTVAFGIQLLAVGLMFAHRVALLDFYRASACLMLFAAGFCISAGEWVGLVPGALAGLWVSAAVAEPARARRRAAAHRALRQVNRELRTWKP